MILFHFALPALIAGLTGMAVAADEKPPAHRYQACLLEVAKFPKDAFEDAIQWSREGGGGPAEHCAASALMALGLYAEAAKRLEAVAQSENRRPQLRAGILAQAGQAFWAQEKPGFYYSKAATTTALYRTVQDSSTAASMATLPAAWRPPAGAHPPPPARFGQAPGHGCWDRDGWTPTPQGGTVRSACPSLLWPDSLPQRFASLPNEASSNVLFLFIWIS